MKNSKQRLRDEIARALRLSGDRVCLSGEGFSWSGHDVQSKCLELGQRIIEDSNPGDDVIIYGRNSPSMVVAILATLLVDRVAIILNPRDHSARIKSLSSKLILTSDDEPGFPQATVLRLSPEAVVQRREAGPGSSSSLRADPRTVAVLYTSGSSGIAKGVEVSAEAILYLAEQLRFSLDFDTQTIACVFLPLSHTMSLNTIFFPTFLAGGQVHVLSTSLSMTHLYRDLLSSRATHVALTSELIAVLYREMRILSLGSNGHVRRVQISGGLSSKRASQMVAEMFPQAILYKGYGLTEATRIAMVSSLDSSFFTDYPEYTLLPGVHVQIRDESGRVLGPDSHGYIHIQGPTCTPRVRDSQQTVIGDDYFLKTGDFGSLSADRKLQIRGRFDGVVKINGRHVLLQEIETQALSYFPEWITAQVLLKHVGERLQLFVVYEAPDWAQAKDETIKHFRRELRLKLGLPVHTLRVEQMPRAQNGKIQRNRLEQDVDQALKLQYGLG